MRNLALSCLIATALAGAASASPPAAEKPTVDPNAARITGAESYIPTFGLRASISRGFGISGVISVDAGLDVPDKKERDRANAYRPRIISALRDAVLNYASQSYIVGERPDTDILRARMQRTVDQILGPNIATVTLASVMIFNS